MIWRLARYAVFAGVVYAIIESGLAETNSTLAVGIGAVVFTAVLCVPLV